MKKYLTEFIGTFFLVLTISLTVISGSAMAPLAIGCSLMIMVYMGGHISGGHYNPAVTLGFLLRGRMNFVETVKYWVSQLAGAMFAAGTAWCLLRVPVTVAPNVGSEAHQWMLVEILFTFALCLVVFNVADQDLQALLREFSEEEIATILKGKDRDIRSRILDNISDRMQQLIGEESDRLGAMKRRAASFCTEPKSPN